MTDDAQAAAAQAGQGAPRLTHEREAEIRHRVEYLGPGFERLYLGDLLAELDATRADLQQALASEANLRAMLEQVIRHNLAALTGPSLARLEQALAATTRPTMRVTITQAMSETCGACGHERRAHLIDEWCSQCDCQWFGPQLDKHNPADHQADESSQP